MECIQREGKIRSSESPAGAPIHFVPKAIGRRLWLCVDYRKLNMVTVSNRYPLPLLDELQDRAQRTVVITNVDIKNSYNLIRMKMGDKWKTAFRCRYGHFQYLVILFKLFEAAASFHNMVNDILKKLLD